MYRTGCSFFPAWQAEYQMLPLSGFSNIPIKKEVILHPPKAITIAAEIESRICRGFYTRRLPTTDILRNEFQAARQTITDALKLLSDIGVLTSSAPRNGVRISDKRFSSGTIAIVSGSDILRDDLVLTKEIIQDGFKTKIYYPSDKEKFSPENAAQFAGVLFINSSLTADIADALNARKIPFVSCNRITYSKDISFIDYDQEQLIRFMLKYFSERNFHRISFFYSSILHGYNKESMRLVRKVKRELGLPISAYDHFTASPECSISDNFTSFMNLSLKKEALPEVLIAKRGLLNELETFAQTHQIVYPENFHFVFHRLKSERIPKLPWVHTFIYSYPNWRLWIQGYKLLREKILVPSGPPQHKNIPQKIIIKQ